MPAQIFSKLHQFLKKWSYHPKSGGESLEIQTVEQRPLPNLLLILLLIVPSEMLVTERRRSVSWAEGRRRQTASRLLSCGASRVMKRDSVRLAGCHD